MSTPTIAFCTACMNRRWQLEQTLPENLAALEGSPHFLAVCDYNSADDLTGLLQRFNSAVRRGTLVHFQTTEPRSFHMSSAKNTAHRLALRRKPDVLFNLDADNWISRETITSLEQAFTEDSDTCFHSWNKEWATGMSGRIAMSAHRWVELGGYDESFLPVGWQDIDLLYRARAVGLRYRLDGRGVRSAIANAFEEKMANVDYEEDVSVAIGGPSAHDRYHLAVTHNLVASLSRPIRQSLDQQRRFKGRLNSSDHAEI